MAVCSFPTQTGPAHKLEKFPLASEGPKIWRNFLYDFELKRLRAELDYENTLGLCSITSLPPVSIYAQYEVKEHENI
jgi:hypothetical protein